MNDLQYGSQMQQNPEFLDVIGDTKFDIIIDDGSHMAL